MMQNTACLCVFKMRAPGSLNPAKYGDKSQTCRRNAELLWTGLQNESQCDSVCCDAQIHKPAPRPPNQSEGHLTRWTNTRICPREVTEERTCGKTWILAFLWTLLSWSRSWTALLMDSLSRVAGAAESWSGFRRTSACSSMRCSLARRKWFSVILQEGKCI